MMEIGGQMFELWWRAPAIIQISQFYSYKITCRLGLCYVVKDARLGEMEWINRKGIIAVDKFPQLAIGE